MPLVSEWNFRFQPTVIIKPNLEETPEDVATSIESFLCIAVYLPLIDLSEILSLFGVFSQDLFALRS